MFALSNHARAIRSMALAATAALGLSACGPYDGYGYSGVNVGYGTGYYDDGYGSSYYGSGYGNNYSAGYGWYGDYYYPGNGYLVYDRAGRSQRWNGDQQRYFEGRRYAVRDREDRRDFRQFRRDGVQDRREFRTERRDDRQALRNGTITQEQFRTDRQADRQAYRAERRDDRREFRQDLRDRPGAGMNADRAERRALRQGGNEGLGGVNRIMDRQQRRAERRSERQR